MKPTKVEIKCGRKRTGRHSSKRSGQHLVSLKSGKILKEPIHSAVVKPNGKRSVYCRMYEQEAKDIEHAMDVLAKFAHD